MNDFVLPARGFWRISSSLSLVTTKYLSCYIRFPHIMQSKHISNRKQTYWKNKVHWVKQTIKLYEFFLWKTIFLVTHCFIVYTPDYKYRALHFFSFSCLLEYRLFIASKHMSSQRTTLHLREGILKKVIYRTEFFAVLYNPLGRLLDFSHALV